MRLLRCDSSGEIGITRDLIDDLPAYAILSHTWGAEEDEVTFDDMEKGTGTTKKGYWKLRFCAERAQKDGLRFFWVDTCCINKPNLTELSEAVVSMFHWYRGAAKCYAYLSDVSVGGDGREVTLNQAAWEPAFRASRWFTRGWTLPELLAPRGVDFFSRKGRQLGTRETLEGPIHEVTGIAVAALRGRPLADFGVKERLAWARGRRTTRKEDEAYCLLGIFDVFMPLIYGERERAWERLRAEIDRREREASRGRSNGSFSWRRNRRLDIGEHVDAAGDKPPSRTEITSGCVII